MTLSGKIGAGFAAVLLLHIAVAVMGHLGQQQAGAHLDALESANRLTQHMLTVDRLVGELQSNVQGYTFSGNRGLALRSKQTYTELLTRLDVVQRELGDVDRDAISEMRERLAAYSNNFHLAIEDRNRREQLVQQALPHVQLDGERHIARLSDALGDGEHSVVQALQVDLLAAENGAHEYLAQLDATAIGRANDALAAARDRLDDHVHAHHDAVAGLERTLQRFEEVLLGLVQTTRSYLHLVHVVMAAEAVEVLRSSAALRAASLERVAEMQETIEAQQRRYQFWSVTVSVATILLGLLAGAIIGRIVVQPLRSITETLGKLTRGERAEVPGLSRRDEIGDMALAAQRLRERNEETRRLSEQREQMILDLERTNRDLDNFAQIASHDLKAPLRAIGTIVRWIEEDCGEALPEAGREHLTRLNQRVMRMSTLLADLHEYSRASRAPDAVREIDLVSIARDVAQMTENEAFPVALAGDAEVRLRAAPVPLTQVIGNLLSNAIRHHDREAGVVSIRITRTETGASVSVTDDGPGIPEKHQQRIFEPFETLQAREDGSDSGVGLAIVTKLVERYEGRIEVESPVRDGRGTRFVVDWPEHPPEPAPTGGPAAALVTA